MEQAMYRIIVPLDGSERAEQALPLGLYLADSLRGRAMITQVVPRLDPPGIPPDGARDAAADYLGKIAANRPERFGIDAVVREGDPAEEIVRLATANPASIVVMSTHGRGGLGRLVFGSVADEVARSGVVPVALVRDGSGTAVTRLRTILVAVDGSPLAEQSIPLALELARRTGAAIALVRVIVPAWLAAAPSFAPETVHLSAEQAGAAEQEGIDEARRYLDLLARRLRDQGARVVWEVRSGRPSEEIVRMAETSGADLIIISSHGRGGMRRWALGSVADEVLQRGRVPVLMISAGAAGAAVQPVELREHSTT